MLCICVVSCIGFYITTRPATIDLLENSIALSIDQIRGSVSLYFSLTKVLSNFGISEKSHFRLRARTWCYYNQ